LRTLRDINKEDYAEIKARERFDFAKVLYAKGQYKASIDMLDQVKKIASSIHKEPLLYLALAFEKQIESQHVTGSMAQRAETLSLRSTQIVENLKITDQLSNLSLTLYGIYLKRGYVKSKEDIDFLENYFSDHLPEYDESKLDFFQRLYLYQSFSWYHQMLQEFHLYFKFAQKWVDLFSDFPEMIQTEATTYMKGWHNVLNALFLSNKFEKYDIALNKLTELAEVRYQRFSRNEHSQLMLFRFTHLLNRIFLTTEYNEGVEKIKGLEKILLENRYPWDLNRRLVFNYKIACVYFGANDLNKSIFYLNKITNFSFPEFKEDIQCFARILNLIAHYELGNDVLVSYQVKSVYRFLLKMKEVQQIQKEILKFIRKTPAMQSYQMKGEFIKLKKLLVPLEQDKIERRPFLYLDIISWLDSKIKKISMVEAIRARRKKIN